MSDEFIKLATQEIHQEISSMSEILYLCGNNDEIIRKANDFQKHTHKIKGLAPMMGQEDLGELASEMDFILKQILVGANIQLYDDLSDCVNAMKNVMILPEYDLGEIKKRIREISANLRS